MKRTPTEADLAADDADEADGIMSSRKSATTAVERIVAVIEASEPSSFITLPLSDADDETGGRTALNVACQQMMNRGFCFGPPYRNADAGTVTMRRMSRKTDPKGDLTTCHEFNSTIA